MMNSDTQPIRSGYIHNASVSALARESAAHCLRTGCAPVIVLSQAITRDPKAALDTIALHLFNRGLTGGTQIHTFSLLVLLSSGKSQKEILAEIFRQASANDGLVFLEDAYRSDYDRARAMALLDQLALVYQYPFVRCPLVLKTTAPFDRSMFRNCPNLYANCFHLALEPVTVAPQQPRPSQPRPEPRPEPHPEPRPEVREEPPRQAAPQTQSPPEFPRAGSQPEPQASAGSQKPPKKDRYWPWKRNIPWYKVDSKLYDQEMFGLDNYLRSRRLACSVEPVILYGGRLAVNVRLNIQELGNCRIVIVYDHGFSREDRDAVRIAMTSGDNSQLRARLSLVEHSFDQELGGHLFNPRRTSGNQIFNSSGAAALDAIIRAMI